MTTTVTGIGRRSPNRMLCAVWNAVTEPVTDGLYRSSVSGLFSYTKRDTTNVKSLPECENTQYTDGQTFPPPAAPDRLRSRLGGGVHTKPEERRRILLFGKALGRAINELITIAIPSTVSLTDCYGFAANRRCSSINGA